LLLLLLLMVCCQCCRQLLHNACSACFILPRPAADNTQACSTIAWWCAFKSMGERDLQLLRYSGSYVTSFLACAVSCSLLPRFAAELSLLLLLLPC
jgi:hypothetical protein